MSPLVILALLGVLTFAGSVYAIARSREHTRRIDELLERVAKLDALEATIPTEARAARRGSAAFEVSQRELGHELRNRMTDYEARLDEHDRLLGIVRLPPDATGQLPTMQEPFDPERTPPR
ncbi:MAG TPA: hypothetical protein VFG69_01635 [Nannocystaceae bacterium]|nr:hypothetical protein [Nannocystaceae bacterium]